MLLGVLLPHNKSAIQELLQEVGAGYMWRKVLAVPPPVQPQQVRLQACLTVLF